MKILILDDHPLFSHALKMIVQNISSIRSVDIVDCVETALDKFKDGHSYELLLVDIGLPGLDGFSFIKYLRNNFIETPVVFISASNDPNISSIAIQHGAKGFIHKTEDTNIILQKIKLVLQGHILEPKKNITDLPLNDHSESVAINLGITSRQLSILKLLECGSSNKEIANELNITDSTVKKHVSNVLSLLGVANRTALVAEAQRLKLI